jgi:hypothetical protein
LFVQDLVHSVTDTSGITAACLWLRLFTFNSSLGCLLLSSGPAFSSFGSLQFRLLASLLGGFPLCL